MRRLEARGCLVTPVSPGIDFESTALRDLLLDLLLQPGVTSSTSGPPVSQMPSQALPPGSKNLSTAGTYAAGGPGLNILCFRTGAGSLTPQLLDATCRQYSPVRNVLPALRLAFPKN